MKFFGLMLLLCCITFESLVAKSGLPVPRFVSLRSAQINVRVGPGKDFPIEWVYMRANLPVEIVAEFENWRKIKDVEGAEGWVHQSMLSGNRFGLVQKETYGLKDQPRNDGVVIAQLEPDVMVRVQKCQGDWCRVQIDSHRGWLPRQALWGVYADEAIN